MQSASYDQIAEWYDEQIRTGRLLHNIVLPALLTVIGKVQGQQICDLACGQGVAARQLAQRGAHIVGIDLSERLLALAQQEEDAHPLHIVYQLDDAQKGQTLADASFDGVVCNMALMDIPDLTATFRTVWRILRSHGWFAFSITPPCLQMPGSFWVEHHDGIVTRETGNYFAEGFWVQANATGVKGRVGAHHRIVSTYLNTLVQAGFQIRALAEPRAEGVLAEQFPAYRELPAALVVYSMKI